MPCSALDVGESDSGDSNAEQVYNKKFVDRHVCPILLIIGEVVELAPLLANLVEIASTCGRSIRRDRVPQAPDFSGLSGVGLLSQE